eukprot:6202447-Prymnesium_polylepis.1
MRPRRPRRVGRRRGGWRAWLLAAVWRALRGATARVARRRRWTMGWRRWRWRRARRAARRASMR